jgi:hypothetical protein
MKDLLWILGFDVCGMFLKNYKKKLIYNLKIKQNLHICQCLELEIIRFDLLIELSVCVDSSRKY